MAWTAPTTRATGTLITASIWNTDIVDNLDALFDPPSDEYVLNEGSNYSTTSNTFVDVDSTNLSLDVDVAGDTVLVGFSGNLAPGNLGFFDVTVDGVRVAGDDGILVVATGGTLPGRNASFVYPITGLSPGTRTFRLQWKVNSSTVQMAAGAGTSNADIHPKFWAIEIG